MDMALDYRNAHPVSDRRVHTRRRISSLAYADLGMENGGIVLDLSEGGMAVQAVVPFSGEPLPKIRFQLPDQVGWIETPGRLAWLSESKRDGGIEFTGLSDAARAKVRAWISAAGGVQAMPKERRSGVRSTGPEPGAGSDGASEIPVGAGAGEANGQEHDGSLDLMVSTAEFSIPHAIGGRSPMEAPSSTMVAPLPEPSGAGAAVATGDARPAEPPFPFPGSPQQARNPRPATGSIFDRENGPDLRLFGHGMDAALAKPKRNWAGIAVLVIVLALASFGAGLEAADGNLNPALGAIKARVTGFWATVSQAAGSRLSSQPNATAATPNQPAANPPAATGAATNTAQGATADSTGALPPTAANSTPPPLPGWTNIAKNQPQPAANQSADPAAPAAQAFEQASAPAGGSDSTAAPAPKLDSGVITTAGGITIRSQQLLAIPSDTGYDPADQTLRLGHLSRRVDPVYPADARRDWIEGTVEIRARTAPNGIVDHTEVISGDSRLAAAAVAAVRNWRYEPTLLGGKPVATEEEITFVFQLPHTGR